MKQILTALLLTTLGVANAQICNIDYTQSEVGIYPDTLPTGYAGSAYSEDITFVMPTDTLGYDFTNFHILSVALPVGLSWTCNNNTTNCDYNPQISQHGCIHISGTPLLAGSYTIDATVLADLTILSGYPFVFQIHMDILPSTASISNNGFTSTGAPGCAPALVQFTNNNPGLAQYYWDFGNGNVSFAENPSPQFYANPGAYLVSYTAYANLDTTPIYTLTDLHISNMSNYGGGFPSFENADAYFKVFENGQLYYQSTIIGDQNPPVQWTLNLNINPNNTYIIEIWEADESFGETYFGADDFIGSHHLNLNGCNGCSAGASTFNYTINHQLIFPTPQVNATDTIHVYDLPTAPFIFYDSLNHTLNSPDLGLSYQWYFNDSPVSGATSANQAVYQSGQYYLVAINPNGCIAFSDTMNLILDAGIKQQEQNLPKIYPNPNNGLFQIDIAPEWIGSAYQLTDLQGKLICQGQISESKQLFNLQDLQNGIYLFGIQNQTQTYFLRIVKNS